MPSVYEQNKRCLQYVNVLSRRINLRKTPRSMMAYDTQRDDNITLPANTDRSRYPNPCDPVMLLPPIAANAISPPLHHFHHSLTNPHLLHHLSLLDHHYYHRDLSVVIPPPQSAKFRSERISSCPPSGSLPLTTGPPVLVPVNRRC